jgi:hypothetical protein
MKPTIETNLRRILRPVVNRRQRLLLLQKMMISWFIAAFAGIVIIAAGWQSSAAFWILLLVIAIVTAVTWYKSPAVEPDYKVIAKNIEKLNPQLHAVLLTAVEQKPQEADGQFGFLQERVIGEAISYAKQQNWTTSVSNTKLGFAILGQVIATLCFIFVLLQLTPSFSFITKPQPPRPMDYLISVKPGDVNVELGSHLIITAKFEELVPGQVDIMLGTSPEQTEKYSMEKNLEDPEFGIYISKVNSDMFYHIEYEGRQTKNYKIKTFEFPSLQRADVNIVYPQYTGLPAKTIKDARQFGVPEGSKVTMVFTLNKPVQTAVLGAKNNSTINLTADSNQPNVLITSFVPKESIKYELKLVDAEGLANKVPDRFTIDVHKNNPPQVKSVFPNRDIEPSALEEISLEAKVSDDYGLTAYGISYNLAGTQGEQIALGQSAPANKEIPLKYTLAIENLKAEPSQLLTYYFWAEDMGPDGNTRRSVSDLYFAEIRPFEEILRESQSFNDLNSQQERERQQQQNQNQQGQQSQQRENLIQLQKQILTATWNIKRQSAASSYTDKRKDDLDLVRQSQARALEQVRSSEQGSQDSPMEP